MSAPVKTPYIKRWKKTSKYQYGWVCRCIGDAPDKTTHEPVGLGTLEKAQRWMEKQNGNR